MNKSMIPIEHKKLEATYNKECRPYGVSCKAFSLSKYVYSNEKDTYLVFGSFGVPDYLNVKDIYIRNQRSNALFYTDYYVIKLDEDASPLGMVDKAVSFCKTVEFLKKLFSEFQTRLPTVIRGDEIGGLKEFNLGRNNPSLSPVARAKFQRSLKKFFKQERTRSKYLQKWRAFSRTDQFDRKASVFKMFRDFYNRNSQITELELLHETNDDLKTTLINEHEFIRFKEDMRRLYPDVLYAVSELEVQNEGFDAKNDRNKPVSKIKSGPFGKLVTYEAYCEEREKKFATKGYESIMELNPAYYETRQLTYKEIDEPFVASVLNTIRFAYAKSDELHVVKNPNIDAFSYIDLPVGDMMNFVSLAKANHVPFYLDCFGKFGKPGMDSIRIIYSPTKDKMMGDIVRRMVDEKFQLSHIRTSLDSSSPSLDKKIDQAQHVKLNAAQKRSLEQDSRSGR